MTPKKQIKMEKTNSKRVSTEVVKEDNQNLKMNWVIMHEQRKKERKKEQNKLKAKAMRDRKKVSASKKG